MRLTLIIPGLWKTSDATVEVKRMIPERETLGVELAALVGLFA